MYNLELSLLDKTSAGGKMADGKTSSADPKGESRKKLTEFTGKVAKDARNKMKALQKKLTE